jgi:hypothetical protein
MLALEQCNHNILHAHYSNCNFLMFLYNFYHSLMRGYDRNFCVRNVTIRQHFGLEETNIKEIEQNQLTWYGHVQRMAEGRLPKISFKWMPKQNRARGRPKKKLDGMYKEGHERKKPK